MVLLVVVVEVVVVDATIPKKESKVSKGSDPQPVYRYPRGTRGYMMRI